MRFNDTVKIFECKFIRCILIIIGFFLPGLYPAFFLQCFFKVVISSVARQSIDEFKSQ